MTAPIGAVIMLGGTGNSPAEQLVWRGRAACVLDSARTLLELGMRPVIVAAPSLEWLPTDLDVVRDADGTTAFHFGRRLAGLIAKYRLEKALYLGGGSIPLLSGKHLAELPAMLADAGPLVLTNNVHSADWFALGRADLMLQILSEAERDNTVPWLLREAGYEVADRIFPSELDLDIDTPADLALAALHGRVGPELRRFLGEEKVTLSRIPIGPLLEVLNIYGSQVALFGRVSAGAWEALSRATSVWIRVYSEERGMVASGRVARGEVKSLIGALTDKLGPTGFFDLLAETVDAAIIDSRVLMAHRRIWPYPGDRFASDLMMWEWISEPWLREFTRAASEAVIPVLLGGHNVVSVGLRILAAAIGKGT